jgi:hypothetical protein
MSSSSAIKAGEVFMELSARDAGLQKGLDKATASVKLFGIALSAGLIAARTRVAMEGITQAYKQVASGAIGAKEAQFQMAESLLGAIPVFGDFYKAAAMARDILDGTVDAAIALEKALTRLRKVESAATIIKGQQKTTAGLNNALALETAGTDPTRKRLQLLQEFEAQLARNAEEFKKVKVKELEAQARIEKEKADGAARALLAAKYENLQKEEMLNNQAEAARFADEYFDAVQASARAAERAAEEAAEIDEDRAKNLARAVEERTEAQERAAREAARIDEERADNLRRAVEDQQRQRADKIMEAIEVSRASVVAGATGTFNARALQSLQSTSGGPALQAALDTARNTQRMANDLARALTFQ